MTYCKQDRFHSGTKVVEEVEWVAVLAGAEEVKQHLFNTDDMFESRSCVYLLASSLDNNNT